MTEFYTDQPLQYSPGQCLVCHCAVTSVLFVRDNRRVFIQIEPVELAETYVARNRHLVPAKPHLPLYVHKHPNYTMRGPHVQIKDAPQTA